MSPELVCLFLFDTQVSDEEKASIVRVIEFNPDDYLVAYEAQFNELDASVISLSLSDFVNISSLHYIYRLIF